MEDTWQWSNFWGCVGLSVLLPLFLVKRVGWIGALLWAWVLTSAVRTFMYPWPFFPGLSLQMNRSAGQAFCLAALIPLAALMIPARWFRYWHYAVVGMVIAELGLIYQFGYGLMNANSFDGGWIATMMPLIPPWLALGCFILLFKLRGATAFMVMAVEGLVLVWNSPIHASVVSPKKAKYWATTLFLLVFPAVAYLSQGHKLFNDSERVQTWQRSLDALFSHNLALQGIGIGTFQWVGPALQGFKGDLFLQMHNDWVQCLMEAGWIGITLMVLFFAQCVWKARNRPILLASLLGTGAMGLTYHPLHFFPSALWVMLLVRECREPIHEF